MQTLQVQLTSIEAVRKFVELANLCDFDVTVSSGKYRIDGKSIMGIFSLDLTKPVKVELGADHVEEFAKKFQEIAR